MTTSLYTSGYAPPRVKAEWDRCSMGLDSAKSMLGTWSEHRGSALAECVAWFDDDGAARVIVGQYESGDRVIVRRSRRDFTIRFERPSLTHPQEAPNHG